MLPSVTQIILNILTNWSLQLKIYLHARNLRSESVLPRVESIKKIFRNCIFFQISRWAIKRHKYTNKYEILENKNERK